MLIQRSFRPVVLSVSLFALAACGGGGEEESTTADELGAANPQAWSRLADLQPASGAYHLRSLMDPGSLAKCGLYQVVTVEDSRMLLEERPLYYELDRGYVDALRSRLASGMRTEEFNPYRDHGTSVTRGVVKFPTSPYAGSGTSTLEFYKAPGKPNLLMRYSVESAEDGRFPKLVCEYERMAGTVKEMAPAIMKDVKVAWEGAKRTLQGSSDAQTDALCKAITTNPYWSTSAAWSKGLCDAPSGAANRAQLVEAVDAALKSLAKEQRGLTDPEGAYGGPTRGEERLYRIVPRTGRPGEDRFAVFGGFAPTELHALELEATVRRERCADAGLATDDCKLHGAIKAAFSSKYHDAESPR